MEKIRKGKDIAVTWKVTTNGQDISLVRQDLILKVWGANTRPVVLDFDIIEPNTLSFVWHGESQSNSGEYYLSLFKANSPKSIVDTPFVQLVNRSWEEEDAVRSDLQTETVELESGNFTYNGDYNQLANKPTINGVDFVGNINLYHKSEMDELLTGKQDVIVDLDIIRSNAQAGKEASDELSNKVDKEEGKGLSANDYTDTEKSKVGNLPLDTNAALAGKQPNIEDLATIRSNAYAGKTANDTIPLLATKTEVNAKYTKPDGGIPKSDLHTSVQESLDKADSALQQHQDISHLATKAEVNTKQDIVSDLATIRSNAGEGHTAYGWGNHALQGYITKSVSDLANYYLKSETYTKAEVLALIDAIKQFSYEVVAELPTASASTMHKIYLVPSAESKEQNIKDEFITILDGSTYKWEQIGSTAIDLSDYPTFEQMTSAINTALVGYATSTDLSTAISSEVTRADGQYATKTELNDKQDTLVSGTNIKTVGGASILGNGDIPIPTAEEKIINGYYYNGQFYAESTYVTVLVPESGKIYIDLTSGMNKEYIYNNGSYQPLNNDMFSRRKYCVGKWLEDAATATDAQKNNPDALEVQGDRVWATKWLPHLYDMTPRQGETAKVPVLDLNRANWLRDTDGNFAPVVGITQAQYDECMTNALYLEGGTQYCAAGAYNANDFFANHCSLVNDNGVMKMVCDKLYKAGNVEVTHYLMPYETTERKYSIFVAHDDTLYTLDNVVGESGAEWNGVLGPGTAMWDGIDLSKFKLVPTGICPSPCTCIKVNNTSMLRAFYFDYDNADYANANGYQGQGNICTFFKGGHYPYVMVSQIDNMDDARHNNFDPTSPVPVAEGGYHARNTFLKCMETAFGTKYLHKNVRFSSGISANDTCNSESTWLSNGGVRYRQTGASAWSYCNWNVTTTIYYQSGATYKSTNAAELFNAYNLRSKTLESQMAVSFAKEWNIAAGQWFMFRGFEWKYENVTELSSVKSLANGEMNCRVYKKITDTISAYNSDGTAQSFDIEIILRVGLMEGCDLSGDGGVYWGGGAEIVGLAITPGGTASGNQGDPALCYLQADQSKWVYDKNYNNLTVESGDKYLAELSYDLLGQAAPGKNSYMQRHVPYSPAPLTFGGGLSTGETAYAYDTNYWGVFGKRARQGLRFGSLANYGFLAPRYLEANYYCAVTARRFSVSAQVLHSKRSPLQAE